MNAKSFRPHANPCVWIAAAVACTALSSSIQAHGHEVTVMVPVSTAGIDLREPDSVRKLYGRVKLAARAACGQGPRVGLQAPPSFVACYEKALADAVRSAHLPQLREVYLATHTLRDAATYGIEAPERMAAQ